MKSQKGQGVIESLITLPFFMLAAFVFSFLCYRATVFYLSDLYLHEALMCLNEKQLPACQDNLKRKIQKIIIFKNQKWGTMNIDPLSVKLKEQSLKPRGAYQGKIEIRFPWLKPPYDLPVVIEKQIQFPLKSK